MKKNKNQKPILDDGEFDSDYVRQLMNVWVEHFGSDLEAAEISGVSKTWFYNVRKGYSNCNPGKKLCRGLGIERFPKFRKL